MKPLQALRGVLAFALLMVSLPALCSDSLHSLSDAVGLPATEGDAVIGKLGQEGSAIAPKGFEENKGQVRTTEGQPAPFVRYRLTQGSTQLFLLENGIAYQFSRTHYPDGFAELSAEERHDPDKQRELEAMYKQIRVETYRMDMLLEDADPKARITTEGKSSDYTMYYNHDALNVHSFTKVTYHDVWPGIDWVIYTTEAGMKYDFVVRPGADPEQVRLRFKQHEELYLDPDGNLVHGNRMGRFIEQRPVSFQEGIELPTRFQLEGDVLRFVVDDHDTGQVLTIDPARVWGTYYGGTSSETGTSCAVDVSGNVYLTGLTGSSASIASGGHQNSYNASGDAFLVKFDGNGVRLWGTYYGGTQPDSGESCAVDGDGNVYLAGSTRSTSSISFEGHQNAYGGGVDLTGDAFLVKFNANGVRQWATYYGGSSGEEGFSCIVGGDGSVYLAGRTQSASGIASGGHQNTLAGGSDAFLVKFNPSGVRQWATYYGGSAGESGRACAVDNVGNVYLAGNTGSASDVAQDGHQVDYGGDGDAFLVKFNGSGERQWSTYYGGDASDQGNSCAVDLNNNVYLTGTTRSVSGISMNGHQNIYAPGLNGDAYLVKFDSNGQRVWGTYYGGTGDSGDQGNSCAVDGSNNVYLAGNTGSSGVIASGGHQNSLGGGGQDAFLVKFDMSGQRLWGTYYGGSGLDMGNSCAVDANNDVFIAGQTGSSNNIASGGHDNSLGGTYDAYLVKFRGDYDCPGLQAFIGAPCDDGDPNTGNDVVNENCECEGQLIDCEGVAGGTALPGTPCDDGDANTGNDVWGNDCVCAGELIDCEGVAGGSALPGTPCDDGDANTGNDVWGNDCVCAGELIDCEGVVGGSALPGTPCDDGDASTGNDAWGSDCICVGELIDCEGVAGGSALPGTACDDGNPNTGDETWDNDCVCIGLLIDCEGTPGGAALPGTPCDDGNPNTIDDVWGNDCVCAGLLIDCEGVAGGSALPGTPCDDGDPDTGNDVWGSDCVCAGQLIDCVGVAGGNALPGTPCDDGDPDTVNDTWTSDCECQGDIDIGIYEQSNPLALHAWPNPANTLLYLSRNVQGGVFDVSGRQVLTVNLGNTVHVGGLSSGAYVLRTEEGVILRFIRD